MEQKTTAAETAKSTVKDQKKEYKYKSKHPKPKLDFPTAKNGELIDLKYFSNMLKNEKTRKFYFHLINAFCNKRLIEEFEAEKQRCSILNQKITGIMVRSNVSDVVIAKSVYDVLYRHIMSQCFVNKGVKFIVQETKRTLLINDIADYLDIPANELNYDILGQYTSQDCKKVEQMLHLHDRSGMNRNYKNGRVKAAIELLLSGPIPIKDNEVVRIDHPLIFDKYIPWPNTTAKASGAHATTIGDMIGEELLAKLKAKQ